MRGARARRVGGGGRRLDAPLQRRGRARDARAASLGRHRRHRLRPGRAPRRDAAREQGLGACSTSPRSPPCPARWRCSAAASGAPRIPRTPGRGARCSWSRTRRDAARSTCSSIPRPREGLLLAVPRERGPAMLDRAARGGRRGGRDHRRGGAAPARRRADPGDRDGLAPGRATASRRRRDLDDEAGAPAVLGLRPLPDGGDERALRPTRPPRGRARGRTGGRRARAPRARRGDSAPSAPSGRARRPGSSGRCAG